MRNLPKHRSQRNSGGARPRQKGARAERALVRLLQAAGFAAERIPLSGSAGGSFVGDVTVPLLGADRCVEVKCRANGFIELYRWIDGRDLLVVRADRLQPLVVLPLRLAIEVAAAAERTSRAIPVPAPESVTPAPTRQRRPERNEY
jgi:hypothetical protein